MKGIAAAVMCFCFVPLLVHGDGPPASSQEHWPQWRGPNATGVADHGDPPTVWSEKENVGWRVEIPGKGHATPVVWGDGIFVLAAVKTDKRAEPQKTQGPQRRGRRGPPTVKAANIYKFVVLAIDRKDGKIRWQRTVREELPHEGTHALGSWASSSPVTDGEHVYAHFGSRGIYCFDMQGNLQWEKDLGQMTIKMGFGEGSSPVLYGDKIIINWDHEGQSFIIALDKKTGDQLWIAERDERTAWATPIVVQSSGEAQIITSATNRVRGYDLATGALIWESGGMTRNVIPSPVAANGMVFVASGFRGNALRAIRLSEAKGDISDSEAVVWTHDKDMPYTPSPLLYGGMLYVLKGNNGVLSCFDAETGKEHFSGQTLEGVQNVFASPVGVHDRIYIVGRDGTAVVIKRGSKYEALAKNVLDDTFIASPALAGDEVYLRGQKTLYCIARN